MDHWHPLAYIMISFIKTNGMIEILYYFKDVSDLLDVWLKLKTDPSRPNKRYMNITNHNNSFMPNPMDLTPFESSQALPLKIELGRIQNNELKI